MEKKQPARQCIGCGEKKDKRSLIRVIRTPEGGIGIDETGRAGGRGAYLCKSAECLRKAEKKRALSRSLKMEIPSEIYDRLARQILEEGNGQ